MSENNFESYNIEDDIDNEEGTDPAPRKGTNIFLLLLEIMINPTQGWKKFRRQRSKEEHVAATCFYPLSGIASLSTFARLIYDNTLPLARIVTEALGIFMSLFFGFFISLAFLKIILPRSCKEITDTPFLKEMLMLMLSTLALFYTIYSLLPIFEPIFVFLPVWTIYLISRGTRFLKVPDDKTTTVTGGICVATIGSPILIDWLFGLIAPAT